MQTGIERRQLLAKQTLLFDVCRLRMKNDNSLTFTPEYAEMIAQYAVNIVDFRDADSVMTRFAYDPDFYQKFSTSNLTWNPTVVVWGL